MIKYFLGTIFCCSLFFITRAQTMVPPKNALSFHSIFQAGILEGQSHKTSLQIQSVNGLLINTWFAGIGVGIDYYGGKRSVPLFATIEKDLRKNKKTPFIYTSLGKNFSWLKDKEKLESSSTSYTQSGGLFYELGIGYKFLLKNKMYLGFSAGYAYKQQSEKITGFQFCDLCVPPNPPPPVEEYEYKFRRVSIKMNCWF